jgi:hypothetical protein
VHLSLKVLFRLNFLYESPSFLTQWTCSTLFAVESAYEMITQTSDDHLHSLQKVIELYHYQKDNYDVVSALCTLLFELSQYGKYSWICVLPGC